VIALPQPPAHLLTVAEYAQLGETTTGYTELQEGNLIMSPSSSPRHMIASGRLLLQVQSSCLATCARCRRWMSTWNWSRPISPAWCADPISSWSTTRRSTGWTAMAGCSGHGLPQDARSTSK
jgi:hypothetical protein